MINDTNRQYLATLYNKSLEQLSRNDLLLKTVTGEQTEEELALLTPDSFDNPSGTRWYTIFPTAPILALSMLSEDEIGNQSSKVGFFPADFTDANITATGLPQGSPMILYRGDMRLPNGATATDFIHK